MAQENGPKFRRLRMARTIVQIAAWVCMGLYSEVSGPTLPYLKHKVDCNYEEISRALVARSVGFLTGALLGGVLCDKFYSLTDLWMSISLFLAAIAVTAVPWCTSLVVLCAMFLLDGVGKGILASGGNSLIIKIWGKNAAPPTHAIHFSYGVGALIVPQIARLFLPEVPDSRLETTAATTTAANVSTTPVFSEGITANATFDMTTTAEPFEEPPIEYPFAIVGAITALVGLAELLIFFCRGTTLQVEAAGEKSGKSLNVASWIRGPKKCLRITFILLLCVFWALSIGAERAYGKFIFAYIVEGPLKLGAKKGTIVETLFWATFTAGRGVAILISKFCPPLYMLVVDLGLNVLSAAFLASLAGRSEIVMWIFNCLFGSVLSPLFPACLAWANFYVKMTAMMTALAFIASAAGAFIFSWLSGYLFEYAGKQSLMYLILGYALVISLTFLVLYVVGRKKGKRNLNENEAEQKGTDDEAVEKMNVQEESGKI